MEVPCPTATPTPWKLRRSSSLFASPGHNDTAVITVEATRYKRAGNLAWLCPKYWPNLHSASFCCLSRLESSVLEVGCLHVKSLFMISQILAWFWLAFETVDVASPTLTLSGEGSGCFASLLPRRWGLFLLSAFPSDAVNSLPGQHMDVYLFSCLKFSILLDSIPEDGLDFRKFSVMISPNMACLLLTLYEHCRLLIFTSFIISFILAHSDILIPYSFLLPSLSPLPSASSHLNSSPCHVCLFYSYLPPKWLMPSLPHRFIKIRKSDG